MEIIYLKHLAILKNQSYIKAQAFTNVMAIQTIGDTIFNLEL